MRIVGGKYKSRVLSGFENIGVRPTSDMARESLFNILQNRIYGSEFLDLFSGSGAIGIEAISRGAKKVVFNDFSRESVKVIKKNLEKLKVEEDYQVVNLDAITYLKKTDQKFDIIYVDPPYKSGLGEQAVKSCYTALKEDGLVVLEGEKEFDGEIEGFVKSDRRRYGKAHLTFFTKEK